jgi:hypothetical protein
MVDEYLEQFALRHPSIAAGNGIHSHDGELEDFSAGAIASELRWLRDFRQEAVRGTYDPTYGGYFLGKLAALKLRRDYEAFQGSGFDLQEFHERVMTNGIAPWWAHRQLLLPGDTGPVIE